MNENVVSKISDFYPPMHKCCDYGSPIKGSPINRVSISSLLLIFSSLFSGSVNALPTISYDARSIAMGGAGVAASVSNSPYYNPALVANDDEAYEWLVQVSPSLGETIIEDAGLSSNLNVLKQQLDANTGDSAIAQAATSAIANASYQSREKSSVSLAIPSTILGGALSFNRYKYHSIQGIQGNNNFGVNPPIFGTQIQHKAVEFTDIGISVARVFHVDYFKLGEVKLGIRPKIILFKSYGYNETLDGAGVKLKEQQERRLSSLNFDLGFVWERGVWKTAAYASNIYPQDIDYGESGSGFSLGPKLRIAYAYQGRNTIYEANLDIVTHAGLGLASKTQYAVIGWEHQYFRGSYLRAGYKQNLVGDQQAILSAGGGLKIKGYQADLALLVNENEATLFATFKVLFGDF